MTRPSALVLDGNEVKLRLQAERLAHSTAVHVDWVRFTCLLRNAPLPPVEFLLPLPGDGVSIWEPSYRQAQWARVLYEIPDEDYSAGTQALTLAREVCRALGDGFEVAPEVRKGHDFYKARWSIERNGQECGWVGFLASGDSPRQKAQAGTIHANIYGQACTFAASGWTDRMADLIDEYEGKLTRADLALDFFDGFPGGMDSLRSQYEVGHFDVAGKRPKCSIAGDWFNGCERSLYIGSREAGKQTNIYEKGDQLFGRDAGSEWVRIELRYGNKLRVLPSDILRRPADFFAGASDWHALQLKHFEVSAMPERCPQAKSLPQQTVLAEVSRNVRWAFNTAAPTIAAAFNFLGDEFLQLVTAQKLPGRLQRFSQGELREAFKRVLSTDSTVGSYGPAFA